MDLESANEIEEIRIAMAQVQELRENERFEARIRVQELREVYSTRIAVALILGVVAGFLLASLG